MRVQSSGREWLCENRISWRLRRTSLTHILSACVWPWRRSVCHYSFLFVIIIIVVLLLLLLLLLYFGRTCSRHVIHSLMERNDTHYTPHCRSRSIVSVGSVPRRYIFIISGEHINYKPALNLRSTWFFSIIYLFIFFLNGSRQKVICRRLCCFAFWNCNNNCMCSHSCID